MDAKRYLFSFLGLIKSTMRSFYLGLRKNMFKSIFHGQGLQNTLKDLDKHIHSSSGFHEHWIAYKEEVPFGYLMTSEVASDEERFSKWREGEKAITLDLLIGNENFLGRGLSCPMIQEFLLDKFPSVDEVFIDPEVENSKAIHVYEKAGFKKLEQFIAPWHPVPHWLMKCNLNGKA